MSSNSVFARWLDFGRVLARWVVGWLFLSMGWNKAIHPEAFLKLVRQYDLLHDPMLLNLVAAGLPWFEVFCGLLLIAGVAVRGSALVSLVMLVPFTAVVLQRALAIAEAQHLAFCAVKFDCGCGSGEVFICHKLVENSALIVLCCWLLTGHGNRLCLRFRLFRADSADSMLAQAVAAEPPAASGQPR